MTTRTPKPERPRRAKKAHARTGLTRHSRRRLFVLLTGFGLAFALVGLKLVSIQTVNATRYQQVSNEPVRTVRLAALRGSILASNGDELALSEMRDTIYADPDEVTDADAEAARLARILHQGIPALEQELTAHTTYVALVTGASSSLGAAVTAQEGELAGVGVTQAPVRYYPAGALASPIIGVLNDNGAISGLEYRYNRILTGRAGKLVVSVDPDGNPVPGSTTEDVPAVNGDDLLTTIDEPLQYQAEQALAKAVVASDGTGGTAIVEDTQTGQLLAVASLVSNGQGSTPVEAPSSSAFTQVYEPGSVAKVITISGALTDGVVTPSTEINVPASVVGGIGYEVAGTTFHDAETHPDEDLSPTGVLAQSSNIGATEIAQRMGGPSLYHFEAAFGLTKKTDIDFPGESAGLILPLSQWSGTTLPTLAFGEADAFTAVQMISAINVVANGGVYVPPRLATAAVGPTGEEIPLAAPRPHRVISAAVAREVTGMLEQVVSNGTGVPAQVPSYAVAGKTGTANSLSLHGGYVKGRYTSSFAGFAPAQHPRLTVMVVIDHTAFYGAEAAAPAFSTIMKDALIDLSIPSGGAQPAPSNAALPVIDGQVDTALQQ